MERKSGVVATWVLSASAVGRFRIGPASMVVANQRIVDRPVEVEVVAASANPRASRGRRRNLPFDPFDPFGGSDPFSGPMFPPMPGFKLDLGRDEEVLPTHPPELDIAKAKDSTAFLDARALPKRVVIGEQVRLDVYIYQVNGIEATGLTEPSLDGFISYRSEHDDLLGKAYPIAIGEDRFFARKILSYALFPTKPGALNIGPTAMNFVARTRVIGSNADAFERSSNALTIVVEEPPLTGRPSFYHLGDVGQFKLNATVEPRQIKVGESISVQMEVSGSGQLPQRLDPPEQTGIDWLEPSVSQQIEEQRGLVGGRRQFAYVVRLDREGTIDLGEFKFAYFDPTTRKYVVAKAPLGSITVAPNGNANPSPSATPTATSPSQTPTEPTLHPRGALGAESAPSRPLADRPWFFYSLAVGPFATLSFFGLGLIFSKLNSLRKQQRTSAKAVIQNELDLAKSALTAGELAKSASSVERAVHLVIEHRAGLKSRGILREELPSKLVSTGLNEGEAQGLIELLERCDHLRFVQMDPSGISSLLSDAITRIKSALSTATKPSGASE
jgi:hypothetical protein